MRVRYASEWSHSHVLEGRIAQFVSLWMRPRHGYYNGMRSSPIDLSVLSL